jgi:MOSC domain-containing protein YiiM
LLEQEAWQRATRELGAPVDPSARRANVLLSGVSLARTRGKLLAIGDCRLRIRGETAPCERMDEARAGLRAALRPDWGGGVFAEVEVGGEIRVGDSAGIVADE